MSLATHGGLEKCAAVGAGSGKEEKELNISSTVDNTRVKVSKQEITVGTWNVTTLNALGNPEQLDHERRRYRWAVLGLAEVRWTGIGETTTNYVHRPTLW